MLDIKYLPEYWPGKSKYLGKSFFWNEKICSFRCGHIHADVVYCAIKLLKPLLIGNCNSVKEEKYISLPKKTTLMKQKELYQLFLFKYFFMLLCQYVKRMYSRDC